MTLCPICEQPLPETPVSRCPSCGTDLAGLSPDTVPSLQMPALAPEPEPWPPQPGPRAAGTPWDERGRLGVFSALVETTRQVLTGPTDFFRAMPVDGGIGSPLLYGVILGWIGAVAAGFYSALFYSIVGSSPVEALTRLVNPEAVSAAAPFSGLLAGWGGFASQVVFGAVVAAIVVIVYSGVLHLALLLFGGARRGFEATLRVVSFSQAVSILFLVPFCGQLAAAVWTLVLYVIGLAETHRIGYGRAVGAVLLPLLLLCCCCGVALGILFLGVAGLASQLR